MKKKEYKAVRHTAIRRAMDVLGIRERYIIREYYIKGRTLYDIADEEGISAERVRQILVASTKRMRPVVEEYAMDLR